MYQPRHFEIQDRERITSLIRDWSFATLVSCREGQPFATHLPLVLDEDGGSPRLLGHVARQNPHWQAFDGTTPALAIFQGPHAYISPNWYANPLLVPTWNYVAVHVTGRPQRIDDPAEARGVLERLTAAHESDATGNWSLDRLDPDMVGRQLRGIVAFALPLEQVEAKWKMSQNRADADRAGAIRGLKGLGDPMSVAVASEMEAVNRPD